MKNKDDIYKIQGFALIGTIVTGILIVIYTFCTSCATQKMPYKQAKKEWTCPPEKKYKPKKIRYEKNSFIHHAGSNI